MYTEKSDILNKGVPIELPELLDTDIYTLLDYAIDRESVEEQINNYSVSMFDYMDSLLTHKSHRKLALRSNFLIAYQPKNKSNELIMDSRYILWDMLKYLNIDSKDATPEVYYEKCQQLSEITSDRKLAKKFPELYKIYLEELDFNQQIANILKKHHGNIDSMKRSIIGYLSNPQKINKYIEDSLKIIGVKPFCRIYSLIIKEILDNYYKYDEYCCLHTFDVFRKNTFIGDALEADLALRYITAINSSSNIQDKQKYLYFLTAYFNENRAWINSDIGFRLNNKLVMFDDLYNAYIDILIANPELKVINYNRQEFADFTPEEVEEYMELELKDARANWIFLEKGQEEKRVAEAINNGIKNIKDKTKRTKKIAELKSLYIKKKELFEGTFNYRTVEGKNTFDGYLAYIYPNGKVILERFFEKRKDGKEVIATDQAIYVMNIAEFYSLTNLSKTTIIRDKLCKRYIHKGAWESKIKAEINDNGNLPATEYKKLVLSKKINDI